MYLLANMAGEDLPKPSQSGHHGVDMSSAMTGITLFGVRICTLESDDVESKTKKTPNLRSLEASRRHENSRNATLHDSFKLRRKKKKELWLNDEHRSFLEGLEKLGKGSWKEISAKYVPSRSAAQVASHAQKYFIWLAKTNKKRHSVFDVVSNK
ncbi:transcription factor MYBS2-like [Andrographis paniculata]|uniref:transcription factor MYBS2-like n=1 Tax=Andrographis paniculata TaxID=175694 RepID=UPI0021E998C3|nr:transcription factor MYBS2-like [Andrographis paniculata]